MATFSAAPTYHRATHNAPSTEYDKEKIREKNGRCALCGMQTHKKKGIVSKKLVPITNDHVLNGRCLICHPLPNNESLPTASGEVVGAAGNAPTVVPANTNTASLAHRPPVAPPVEPLPCADSGCSQQQTGDLSVRRGSGTQQSSGSVNHYHDFEEDDEDSRYDQADHSTTTGGYFNWAREIYNESSLRSSLHVQGAGVSAVNGKYSRCGSCDGVSKYRKIGVYHDQDVEFSLFRCRLSDYTRRWYISIMPKGTEPGTNKDIDLYAAPLSNERSDFPPESSWITVKDHGADPPPVIIWKSENLYDGAGYL